LRAKVLVIMTHRLGDIVQVFPALAFMARQDPGREIEMVADRLCADAARLAPWASAVHSVSLLRERPDAPIAGGLQGELLDLAGRSPAIVLNLMANPDSAMLARVAGGAAAKRLGRVFTPMDGASEARWQQLRQLGFPVDSVRTHPVADPARFWRLMSALPSARGWQPFHLSELFILAAAEALETEPGFAPAHLMADKAAGQRCLEALAGPGLPRPWLGLQLGASKSLRVPPQAWLLDFCRRALRSGKVSLVLLGGPAEAAAGGALMEALAQEGPGRLVNAVAQATVAELPGLLSGLDALVSVDTFALHLAAALGTPCVGLYPALASPVETGPYGPGHRVLWVQKAGGPCGCAESCAGPGPGGPPCWDILRPEAVLAEALDLLGLAAAPAAQPPLRRLATVWDGQGQGLKPLDGRPLRGREEASLHAAARAWLMGPGPRVEAQPALAALFAGLARQLALGGEEALVLRQDPADWVRGQLRHSMDSRGRFSAQAWADALGLCRHMARALNGQAA
jgi:ADP-heptose:LPS heptosyltransferase